MEKKPELLYIDLMKKTLSFLLWPEPLKPIANLDSLKSAHREMIFDISKITNEDPNKIYIALERFYSQDQRIEGLVWPLYADTMIGVKRLDNIQYCIETVLNDGVEGDLIETGVWRGGACIFMRAVLAAYGIDDRKVFVADSFEGLPKPDEKKYPADKDAGWHKNTYLAVSKENVEHNFRKYDLLDDQVVFLKGWFKDTLPNAPINKLSILRLDGDMYGSTMETLENLYPKLSEGGFCIIDDYALEACKKAIDDYRAKNNITSEIKEIDWTGSYWRKE